MPLIAPSIAADDRPRFDDRSDTVVLTPQRLDRILGQCRNEIRGPALHEVRPEIGMARAGRAVFATGLGNATTQEL